ncbi:hypothetical protein [Kineosporia sp. NBRC 101731]|uniref:hypothetical protein n=1 Tax=Kineosporia sp. NBRC 101731 TaxID=3032199 RepID=UPI0024A13479|nr:hypothetical protein [Kineosporia sp. NBRC 101731]GLY33648.1 hypothetical protein Kisp02_70130 [Kineosporia sp. NBRC 101731]
MNTADTALWWARARALGPARHQAGTPAPDGFLRLLEPQANEVWLLPAHPGTAGPWVLDEMGFNGPTIEQPNDTARMLAAVVRCCWTDPEAPIWPGREVDWETVLSVYRTFGDREESVLNRAATGAIRRLNGGGWVLWDDDRRVVRLGPRCGTWVNADLTVLRELYRSLPPPEEPEEDSPEEPETSVRDVANLSPAPADHEGEADAEMKDAVEHVGEALTSVRPGEEGDPA